MLQIGLTGLLSYVKASKRSVVIDELLLSKDYISEIIAMAADHFPTVSSSGETNSKKRWPAVRSLHYSEEEDKSIH
jgi:hypothetical protein